MKRRILTQADMEVMTGEVPEGLEERVDDLDRALKQRETRMRNHVRDAVLDIGEICHSLSPENRTKVFSPGGNAEAVPKQMRDAAMAMIEFAYLGLKDAGWEADKDVERAIAQAENRLELERTGRENRATVELNVTANRGEMDITELAERFVENPGDLDRDDLEVLLKAKASAENQFPEIQIMELVEALENK